jgi:hypothetical protein
VLGKALEQGLRGDGEASSREFAWLDYAGRRLTRLQRMRAASGKWLARHGWLTNGVLAMAA